MNCNLSRRFPPMAECKTEKISYLFILRANFKFNLKRKENFSVLDFCFAELSAVCVRLRRTGRRAKIPSPRPPSFCSPAWASP